MKIYSDTLTESALATDARVAGLFLFVERIQRSRVRRFGYHVKAQGDGPRWKNSGKYGASGIRAGTWDQHGQWMARLFSRDPKAVIVAAGRYDGAQDFHEKTRGKYRG